MKHLIYILLLGSLLLGVGCSPASPYQQALRKVDSLCSSNPDSALVMLETWRLPIQKASQDERMYYNLLCVKARDKAYIPHKSDSLILVVVHYYEGQEHAPLLPEAYYYAGRVERDLGDSPQALTYFQKALDTMPQGMTDLHSRVTTQMGTLFAFQGMYPEALEMHKQSLKDSETLQDSVGVIYSLRDVAYAFRQLKQNDSVLPYYKEAYAWSVKAHQQELAKLMKVQIASFYLDMNMYDSARVYLPHDISDLTGANKKAAYIVSAYYYQVTQQIDSATHYINKLLEYKDIYVQEYANWFLMHKAILEGDLKSTRSFLNAYTMFADSVRKLKQTETVTKTKYLYDSQKLKQENERLQKSSLFQTGMLLFAWLFIIAIMLAFILYYLFQKKALQILRTNLERTKWLNKRKDKKLNEQLQDLQTTLQEERQSKAKLEEEIQTIKTHLLDAQQKMDADRMLKEKQQKGIQNTPIGKILLQKSTSPIGVADISEKEWKDFEKVLRKTDPEFLTRFNQINYNFKTTEKRICLLLRAGFTPSQIATLLGSPIQTISTTRSRLAERILGEHHSPKDWDKFIRSL